jgi:hypothetical protein
MRRVNLTDSQLLATQAARARNEGNVVFAPLLGTPVTQGGLSGSVAGWAEMIQAIEAEGWLLADWTVAIDRSGRPQAFPLFRLDDTARHRRRGGTVRLPE